MIRTIKVNAGDNVLIPVENMPQGGEIRNGETRLRALEDIPQGHKIALRDMGEGDPVIRYGVVLGCLTRNVRAGGRIDEHMLRLPPPPEPDEMPYGTSAPVLPAGPADLPGFFEGYDVPGNPFAGTRNMLGIMSAVQCVAGVLNAAVGRIRAELLPRYPNVDGVTAINHAYGCGIAIHGKDSDIPQRTLRNMLRNPNFGGEVMVAGLGCEKFTMDMLLKSDEKTVENVVILQEQEGFGRMMDAIMDMAEKKLERLNRRRRITLPLEKLCVGMQCGGSDAFSGITANPAAGYASDLLVRAGGTVLFSEVTEVRDAVHLLAARCTDRETVQKLAREMKWYDSYLEQGGADRSANPSPGNKQGGLANVLEKAMGSIAKSGGSPIAEVLSPGERPSRRGLIFAATPASDFVCGPLQLASGMGLQVFMTGRGTPYGLAAAPVIKVSSRTDLKKQWQDLIDVDAGTIATGEENIGQVGERIFRMIVDTASGRYKPWVERYGLYNDIDLFDPSPVT
ncbi:MAG: UxaA family hydrolase [Treponema sp.]|jgi:galactarate dehydratase|nr:UxaA family hydrolase [Treponema sp.]